MIELRPLTEADIEAHNAGEDAETVRWLTGGPATVDTTRRHVEMLASNATLGTGKRGFGVWLDDRLAGYVDYDPDADDMPAPGDVNIAYAVHPWARGRGVASAAVALVCDQLAMHDIGRRAVIRAEAENTASVAVARRSGFEHLGDIPSRSEHDDVGRPVVYATFARTLERPSGAGASGQLPLVR